VRLLEAACIERVIFTLGEETFFVDVKCGHDVQKNQEKR
jgi:hypothetical protein